MELWRGSVNLIGSGVVEECEKVATRTNAWWRFMAKIGDTESLWGTTLKLWLLEGLSKGGIF